MTENTPSAASTPSKPKRGILGTILAGTVAVLAFVFSHGLDEVSKKFGEWLGISFLVPILILIATCWLASKLLKPDLKQFNLAVGVPVGQICVLLIPLIYFGSAALTVVGIDILVISVGVLWFLIRPSAIPLLLLLAYEVIALALHFYSLYLEDFSETSVLKGLISAILIRLFAIIVLYGGYKSIKARSVAAAPT